MSAEPWRPFGADVDEAPARDGLKIFNVTWRRPKGSAQAEDGLSRPPGSALMSAATVLLGLLAAGLFVVSLAAQYRYVMSERHQVVPAAIEALGLDVAMTVFSLLALALAWRGLSARTERVLVIACAVGSAGMNYAAANGGSPRSVAAYAMPPLLLAIVVDRVVAVVRRHVLGDMESSAWTGFGRVALYGLRFVLAPPSTSTGLRRAVLERAPLPDASRTAVTSPNVAALAAAPTPASAAIPATGPEPETQVKVTTAGIAAFPPERQWQPDASCVCPLSYFPGGSAPCAAAGRCVRPSEAEMFRPAPIERQSRGETKTSRCIARGSKSAQLIDAYEALQGTDARYGDRSQVSPIARELAPAAGLAWSSARTVLYRHLDARPEVSP